MRGRIERALKPVADKTIVTVLLETTSERAGDRLVAARYNHKLSVGL